MASQNGHEEVVKQLLARPGTDVNKGRIFDGLNPLLMAVLINRPKIVQVLLQHPLIDVNQVRHSDGATALFLAANHGRDSGIYYLKVCWSTFCPTTYLSQLQYI